MYRDAGRALAERLAGVVSLFHREPGVAAAAGLAGARLETGEKLDAQLLADVLAASVRLVPPAPPPPETVARTITLEERATVIRRALRAAPELILQELLRDVRDRTVIAVTFLALLELAKAREVIIEQREPWGPINVRQRAGNGASASPTVVDVGAPDAGEADD
jgi:hypothetical protein